MMKNQKSKIKNQKFRRGFTLVEMLVAVSLFSVVVTVASDIFIRAQRAQRQAAALEKVQDVTRFLMTRMTETIRAGHIAYDCYYANRDLTCDLSSVSVVDDNAIVSDTLAVQVADGSITLFTVRDSGHTDYGNVCGSDERTAPCLVIAIPGEAPLYERATPDGYTITKLAYYITPGKDPLTIDPAQNDYQVDVQPKVTIMMTVRGDVPGIREPLVLSMQTTLSSRAYVR